MVQARRLGREATMAAKKKTTKKATAKSAKAPRKKLGEVALVLRVPAEAVAYLDQKAGDQPRTRVVREILAKGDAKLAKILSAR
jgi:hypothetical protein